MNKPDTLLKTQQMTKVAPNPTQIKKHVMQFFTKVKTTGGNQNLKQKAAAREYLAQLKQEIEERRDEQIMRNQKLLNNNTIVIVNNN